MIDDKELLRLWKELSQVEKKSKEIYLITQILEGLIDREEIK